MDAKLMAELADDLDVRSCLYSPYLSPEENIGENIEGLLNADRAARRRKLRATALAIENDTAKRNLGIDQDDSKATIIREGYDRHGDPIEYPQQGPTAERARRAISDVTIRGEWSSKKALTRLEPPEVDRKTKRHYTRFVPVFELLATRKLITPGQRESGELLQLALSKFEAKVTGSYGGFVSKSNDSDYDSHHKWRRIVKRAESAVREGPDGYRMWKFIEQVATFDLTSEQAIPPSLVHRGGAIPRATQKRHYMKWLRLALGRLAVEFGYEGKKL